jgi:hypothetical protein
MLRHELAIEQLEAAHDHPRHQPRERHLRGVGSFGEHAFAEEGAAEPDAVQAADKLPVLPRFHGMGMAGAVQEVVAALDLGVDPGVRASCATPDHIGKGAVRGDFEAP